MVILLQLQVLAWSTLFASSLQADKSCEVGASLSKEIAALRAAPPSFLTKVGDAYAARQVLDGRKLRLASAQVLNCSAFPEEKGKQASGVLDDWPWRTKVDITVEKGPYKKEHRVILQFPPTWPQRPPMVRFGSKISSPYLWQGENDHISVANGLLEAELARETQKHEGTSLLKVLNILHSMLQRPISEGTESRQWSQLASSFKQDTKVVKKYRKKRKHRSLFTVRGFAAKDQPHPVEPTLRAALANITGWLDREQALASLLVSGVVHEVLPGMVYSFAVFTKQFCEMVMEEVRNFHATGLPARRPNSMNNYGVILNEIGLEPLMFAIQDEVIQPLSAVLFPKEGSELESHHAFTVRYKGGEDTHLDVHTDDSDVTFNVNIFSDYEGCPLVFCGIVGTADHRHFRTAYTHRLGMAVMHSGRHRHGAEDITRGERVNLIIWSYSYNFRLSAASRKKHKREKGPPDLRCLSYTHDRDFGRFKEYPVGKKSKFFGRGWCPQKGSEYEGFIPEVPDKPKVWHHDDL